MFELADAKQEYSEMLNCPNKRLARRAGRPLWSALDQHNTPLPQNGSIFSAESWFLCAKKVAIGAIW
jgi:hypothetical protein